MFSIVRNGVRNGYPFIEAYASWFDYCDRIFVLAGDSDDGTIAVLAELAALDSRFSFDAAQWPADSAGGTSIARFTDLARKRAAEGARRLMYVQADEIFTVGQRQLIRSWQHGAAEFAGCINFWNSLETVVEAEFPMTYLRHFPADAVVHSIGDGFGFELRDTHVTRFEEQILHYGWCFPVNILEKHVNHGRLYADQRPYALRARLARKMLERRIYDRRLLDSLVPRYRSVPYQGDHPECVRHLIGLDVYNPHIGLDLLRAGSQW